MIGTWSANFHQGQRSCEPRKQAGHMSALDQLAKTSKNLLHRRGRPHMCTIASPWHYDAVREFTLSYPTSCSSLRAHSDRNVHVPLFAFDVFEPGPASRA